MKRRKFVLPPRITESAKELERLAQSAYARNFEAKSKTPSDNLVSLSAIERSFALGLIDLLRGTQNVVEQVRTSVADSRPPTRAEYVLYLVLGKQEREAVIGDLVEEYGCILQRFGKTKADICFCKQVIWSLWPFLRQAFVRIASLVWIGSLIRRLNS